MLKTELGRELAGLGVALLVMRVDGAKVAIEGLDDVGGLMPIAVVWDDDEAVVRARVVTALGCLVEQGGHLSKATALAG